MEIIKTIGNGVLSILKFVGIGIAIIILITILAYIFISIKKSFKIKKSIKQIAHLLYEHKDINKITKAIPIVNDYEIEHSRFFGFGSVPHPKNPDAEEEKLYQEYLQYKSFLDSLKSISDDNVEEIYNTHKTEVEREYNKLAIINQEITSQLKQTYINKISEDRKLKDLEQENEDNLYKVSKAIKELERLTEILQDCVDKGENIDRSDLRLMMNHLDTIEDLKKYIAENAKNNLKRTKVLALSTFKRSKNIKDLKENTKLIKNSFAAICK